MASFVISDEAKLAANLRALQRADSGIIDIVASATHVVLYEFNNGTKAWEKRNVEGSLFVAKRSSNPRFKIVVMNRNSKENLEVPLGPSFQMQIREPYLIFKGDEAEPQKIRGIWFHDGDERQSIVEVLNRVVKSLASNDNTGTLQTVPVQSSSKNQGAPTGNINRKKAAASLMAVLKIGGGGSGSEQTRKQQPEKSLPKVEEPSIGNMVLDKKSLQLSLMSLLQEDKFLDLIHAQYLKVAKARANGGTPRK